MSSGSTLGYAIKLLTSRLKLWTWDPDDFVKKHASSKTSLQIRTVQSIRDIKYRKQSSGQWNRGVIFPETLATLTRALARVGHISARRRHHQHRLTYQRETLKARSIPSSHLSSGSLSSDVSPKRELLAITNQDLFRNRRSRISFSEKSVAMRHCVRFACRIVHLRPICEPCGNDFSRSQS